MGLLAAAVGGPQRLAAAEPVEDLKTAVDQFENRHYPEALETLAGFDQRLPQLADYAAWVRASARFESKDYGSVAPELRPVFAQSSPPSPLLSRAVLLIVDAYRETEQPAAAVEILKKYYRDLPQPQADMALADALFNSRDLMSAAIYYQRVYYGYPLSQGAKRAGEEMEKIQEALGEDYPPAMGHALLGRAQKLLEGGQAAAARREFTALVDQLGGADRDLARVRIGVARYESNELTAALAYLSELDVASPEADAERMDYMSRSAAGLRRLAEMDRIALDLARKHPGSPWTADALTAAGNRYLLDNNVDRFEPLYKACAEAVPDDQSSDLCHWRWTWIHYMRRQADAAAMLRDHLRRYPASEQASAALYFLGRLAEQAGDRGAARAYFDEASTEYPNHFYATQARARLPNLEGVRPSTDTREFLASIAFPERRRSLDFDVQPETQARIERAKLLASAGLKDWAERELVFGAQSGEQPHLLAMELARLIAPGSPQQALRYIKRYAAGYLYIPIDSAPEEFWRLTFPLPYRDVLEQRAGERKLDPMLMAGLVRQESEFNARARSRTGARGLSQIQPATGKDIAGRIKVAYSTAKLSDPSYNLQFGTYYLKLLLDQADGRTEIALSGYNGGPTRTKGWLKWADFREPAEFIETVPLTETRNYIQAVLRNAAAYKEIYGDGSQPAD